MPAKWIAVLTLGVTLAVGRLSETAQTPEQSPPRPPLVTISKETTFITEPLRKDGYVDYIAALDRRFREGVTPENNAAVLFLKAFGPGEIKEEHRAEYCRRLGIAPPTESVDSFVTLRTYAERVGKIAQADLDKFIDDSAIAMREPWSKSDLPLLADWLKANEGALTLVVDASRRPRRYDPLLPHEGPVIAVLLPVMQHYREAARALVMRAMLRVAEDEVDAAWSDLMACRRLAQLAGQGPTLVEFLVAVTVNGFACAADQGLLQHSRLSASQLRKMRDDLMGFAPWPRIADRIDLAERFVYLDAVAFVTRSGYRGLVAMADAMEARAAVHTSLDTIVGGVVEWDRVLRMGNSWYDRLVANCRKPSGPDRAQALKQLEREIRKDVAVARDSSGLTSALLAGSRDGVSDHVGRIFVALFLPDLGKAARAEDTAEMQSRLAILAFALAGYRADHGSYPTRLADLTPKYIAQISPDICGDSDLHYRRDGAGYLLYSVGPNGKDDGGKGPLDCKDGEEWDDIAVSVPARETPERKGR